MFPQLEFQIPNGCCFCSLIFCSFFFYFLGNWMYLLLVAGIFGVVVVVVWICIQLFTMGSKTERRCATCSSSRTSVEMNILPFVITFVPYTRLFRLVCMRLAVSVWAEKKKKKKSHKHYCEPQLAFKLIVMRRILFVVELKSKRRWLFLAHEKLRTRTNLLSSSFVFIIRVVFFFTFVHQAKSSHQRK